jgi:hypothetical protein
VEKRNPMLYNKFTELIMKNIKAKGESF